MDASRTLETLREDAGSITMLENRDGEGRIRFVALWRWEAGHFHRSVIAPNTFPVWEGYGEVAAENKLQRDLESTEEATS